MIIKNGMVFTENGSFEPLTITTSGNKITSVSSCISTDTSSKNDVLDATDCYVIPGLIDIHMHGCMGVDFCDIAGVSTQEAANTILQNIASYELSQGITAFCPTTMSLPVDALTKICHFTAGYHTNPPATHNTSVLLAGIYLEGPFLSPLRCGAQNKDCLSLPDYTIFESLMTASQDFIRVVAIAPELEGAMDFIQSVREHMPHVICSLAHTDADYDTACEAFHAGATQVTHLFNAMPPLHHRNPGVVGAAIDSPDCYVECICDGIHLAPSIIRAAFQLFGANRIILISDSTMATGMPDGHYHLGNQNITVQGKLASLADGTIAGSCSNLMDCVRSAVSFGIPLEHAITASTLNPARAIGIDSLHGSISVGKYANLVLLDKSNLEIQRIVYRGNTISYPRSSNFNLSRGTNRLPSLCCTPECDSAGYKLLP